MCVCVCVCVYTNVCVYVYIYVYICIYIYIYPKYKTAPASAALRAVAPLQGRHQRPQSYSTPMKTKEHVQKVLCVYVGM